MVVLARLNPARFLKPVLSRQGKGGRVDVPFRTPTSSGRPADGVLAPYTSSNFWTRQPWAGPAVLVLVCLFYGLVFGVTATFYLLQLLMPLVIPALLVVWLLPDDGKPLESMLAFLFFGYMAALCIWPEYLAISLPGLPWITSSRLFAIPLLLIYLISLSQSRSYRQQLAEVLASSGLVTKLVAAFAVLMVVSIGFSDKPLGSLNKVVIAAYGWVGIFFISCHLFLRPGRASRFVAVLVVSALVAFGLALLEARLERLPWIGYIPSFLQIEDESVAFIMTGKMRAATGIYRLQGKFSTPLGLAEFLGATAPFLLHWAFVARRIWFRLICAMTLPCIAWVIVKTDSRLGLVALLLAVLIYLFMWCYRRLKQGRGSLIEASIIYAYPAVFVAGIVASLTIGRVRNAVWGTGAHQSSNEGRMEQIRQGLPMVLEQPWGYGLGRAAETLGFTNQEGVLTIDTYFLSITLELGVIGFFIYFGMFVAAIWLAIKALPRAMTDPELSLLAPALICLINFIVIKSIFSQQDIHPIFFAVMGMTVALAWRAQTMPEETRSLVKPITRDSALRQGQGVPATS